MLVVHIDIIGIHMDIKNDIKMKRAHGEILQWNVIQEVRLDYLMVFSDP